MKMLLAAIAVSGACLLTLSGCDTYKDDVGRDPIRSTISGNPDEVNTYSERVRAANQKRTAEQAENPTYDPGHTSRSAFDSNNQGPLDTLKKY